MRRRCGPRSVVGAINNYDHQAKDLCNKSDSVIYASALNFYSIAACYKTALLPHDLASETGLTLARLFQIIHAQYFLRAPLLTKSKALESLTACFMRPLISLCRLCFAQARSASSWFWRLIGCLAKLKWYTATFALFDRLCTTPWQLMKVSNEMKRDCMKNWLEGGVLHDQLEFLLDHCVELAQRYRLFTLLCTCFKKTRSTSSVRPP